MKCSNTFARTSIALAIIALTTQAHAQSSPAVVTPAAVDSGSSDNSDSKIDQVVVTGNTSLKRTVRESSVAVTVADREDLDRKAPRSTGEALELIPGMMVESSAGEVSNNFTVRGLAGGGQNFIQLSEDGLPIFYYAGLADTILRQEISIDRLEAVRGGTSGILTVNGAGATVNFLTFKAKDAPEGVLRYTMSDYGMKRLDMRYGAPVGNGWYAGFGGFMRSADSVRDVGFKADHGGLLRGYLGRKFSDGEFSVNLKVVDDHNTFLQGLPFQNPKNPTPIPGFNGNYGTLISPDNAIQIGRNGNNLQTNDATDGVATKATAIGYAFEKAVGDGLTLHSKGRYTDFKNEFNAVFTNDNNSFRTAASRLDPALNSDIAAMLARFPGTTPGIQSVPTGVIYSGSSLANVGGNGLVADSISTKNRTYRQVMVNDVSLTWTLPSNSLTAGLLTIDQHEQTSNEGDVRFLGELTNQPARLDIVALDASGKVAGRLGDKGILQYNPQGAGINHSEIDSQNFYVNDEYKFNERLRLDGGVRYEKLHFRGWFANSKTMPIPGALNANGTDADNIMVNNTVLAADGTFRHVDNGPSSHTSLTAGGNYLVSDNLAAYARYSQSYQANNENPVTKIDFSELGARYKQRGFSGGVTLFRTNFKNFQYSQRVGTDSQNTVVNGNIIVKGIEYDMLWHPVKFAQVSATGAFERSSLAVTGISGPSASTIDIGSIGSHPQRSPDVTFAVTPSLLLPQNKGEVYLTYRYIGKRFADAGNTFVLPAFHSVDLGARYQINDSLALNVNVQNLTNSMGLTQGNPRAGFSELSSNFYFFARPILGRNMQASLTTSF